MSITSSLFRTILIFVLTLCTMGIIAGGCYYGIRVVQSEKSISKTYGIADSEDPYAQYDFYSYDFADIVFASNGNERKYETTIPVEVEFNGEDNKFNVLINNSPCNTTQSTVGIIQGVFSLYFQSSSGTITTTVDLSFNITISASSITYTFATIADDEAFGHLKTYIAINGFTLRIIEEQYNQESISSYVPIGLCVIEFSDELKLVDGGVGPQITTITYNNRTLTENADYTLSYSDNTSYGWGHVTITGKGYYSGVITRNFEVYGDVSLDCDKHFDFSSTNNAIRTKTFSVPGLIAGQDITVSVTQHCTWQFGIIYDKGTYSTKRSNGYWIVGSEFPGSGYSDDFRYTFYCEDDNVLTMEYKASTASGWVVHVSITDVTLNFCTGKAIGYNKYQITTKPSLPPASFNKTIPEDEFLNPKIIELESEKSYYISTINGLNRTKQFTVTALFCLDDLISFELNTQFNEIIVNNCSVFIDFYCFNNEEIFVQINTSNFGVLDGAKIKILNITQ